ncbi:hypothetical protein LJC72_04490 [Bacteroides sp. OttesenSCG-928-D19]|nr:hypothetical protein [Bacteroides sp. OttesenSCG-928-N06]MDL2304582.1 hypothetical protein [Bacteroides sp. OttesenSCG-928-D19]
MKTLKLIIPIAGLLLAGASLQAQTIYDANRFIGNDLNGTARFVGMGGAMGALGGDISTMGTNPAGIGIYRSNDLNISFGFSNVGTNTKFENTSAIKTDKFFGSLDNVGFVLAMKQGNHTPLRYVNFGFNYRKVKSFDRNMSTAGMLNYSQTEQFSETMYRYENRHGYMIEPDVLEDNEVYYFNDIPWLAPLAYNSNLITPYGEETLDYYSYMSDAHVVNSRYDSRERGGIHSYDFNVALNLHDRFYFGATLGVYSIDYRRTASYYEQFLLDNGKTNDGNYTLSNHYDVDGTGVDFKLGFIFRPIESSPLRIGASITTPTFYNISAYQSTSLSFDTYDEFIGDFRRGTVNPYYSNGEGNMPGETEYKLVTPWKFNLSAGYTIGSNVALGAEYEYIDYSSSKLKYDDGVKMDYETGMIGNALKGTHALRLGAEFKLVPDFSLRVGYNYITESIHSDAVKELPINSIRTDTEFSNGKAVSNYTLGFGYRGSTFYADMAYKYNTYKEDFYAFNVEGHTKATTITNDRHQLLFTLGMRF